MVHETISDVDGLYSKLERKLCVENRNLSAASMFHSRFQCDLDALQSSMTSYSQSQQLTCKDFSNKIGDMMVEIIILSCAQTDVVGIYLQN